jgi:hypothetical protein
VGNIGHKVAAHLLVLLQRAGELVKVLRQLAQFVLAAGIDAGGEIPGGQLVRPSTSRFTGASRPRASGKVASAASRVERATISQLVRRCWRSKLMSVLRVRRSTGEAITQPTVALLTLIARRVPSGGIGARGPTSVRMSWSITQNWVRQPCGGMPARAIVTGIVLQRAQDLENKAVVIAQKTPVAVLGVLFTQRIA